MKWSRELWADRNRKKDSAARELDALWEAYAVVRAEAKAANLRAFETACDPNATPEEKAAAWREASEANERRMEAHPHRVQRQKTS